MGTIIDYLESTFPDSPVYPSDMKKKMRAREIAELICSGIQPIQNLAVINYVGQDRKMEFANHFITKGFQCKKKKMKDINLVFLFFLTLFSIALEKVLEMSEYT